MLLIASPRNVNYCSISAAVRFLGSSIVRSTTPLFPFVHFFLQSDWWRRVKKSAMLEYWRVVIGGGRSKVQFWYHVIIWNVHVQCPTWHLLEMTFRGTRRDHHGNQGRPTGNRKCKITMTTRSEKWKKSIFNQPRLRFLQAGTCAWTRVVNGVPFFLPSFD